MESACSVLLDELSFFDENVAYIDLFIHVISS